MKNIQLKGAKNVRDLGEIDNAHIKKGYLLRGTSLENLTKSDIKKLLDDYHVATILDLRTYHEEEDYPDVVIDEVEYIHIPIFDKSAPGITHEKNQDGLSKKHINMTKMYREIVTGKCLKRVSLIIKAIMNLKEEEYAVLFHCTEGKDRTGIIAAILLLILGIDRECIKEDYLYTNKVNQKKANRYYYSTKYLKFDSKKAEGMRNIYLAKEEYIDEVFKVIDEEWQGTDNFIQNGLGISNKEINSFRKKILE